MLDVSNILIEIKSICKIIVMDMHKILEGYAFVKSVPSCLKMKLNIDIKKKYLNAV